MIGVAHLKFENMVSSASTLIIPVENQVRELDAKLLLSCIVAERGFPVIIGSRAFVHFEVASLPRGVYLAKSMRSLSNSMFRILRMLGHEIVAWKEEALVIDQPKPISACGCLRQRSGTYPTYLPGVRKMSICFNSTRNCLKICPSILPEILVEITRPEMRPIRYRSGKVA